MINRIFTLFKIARKLAKSDALKIVSKHYDIPFIIKFLSGILSISFSKEDDVNKSLNDIDTNSSSMTWDELKKITFNLHNNEDLLK